MDYDKWGNEYLKESEALRQRAYFLRASAREQTKRRNAETLLRRAELLSEMASDCRQVGMVLRRWSPNHE